MPVTIQRNGLALLTLAIRFVFASPTVWKAIRITKDHDTATVPRPPADDPAEFWFHVGVSVVLVLAGGVFAGLTLGLMGLDELHLRVLSISSENPKEKANAQKVLNLLQKGRHWVLVIVNESLPIFLDNAIGGGVGAILISTAAIAISVRYGLIVGAACAPLVKFMMYLFAPLAYPIAILLDLVLGVDKHHTYKKAELKSFLQFHRNGEEPLRDEEISILNGVLELNTKNVETIMTPLRDAVVLSADDILDHNAVSAILQSGYSRFPVHEPGKPTSFIGLLLIKKLLTYDPHQALPVSAFPLSILPEAHPSVNCFQALHYFQTGRAHLLLVSQTPGKSGGAIGIVTLEDIIEEILAEEIVDETDQYRDNLTKARARRSTTSTVMQGIVERRRALTSIELEWANESTTLLSHINGRSISLDTSVIRKYDFGDAVTVGLNGLTRGTKLRGGEDVDIESAGH
ncbi:hypothetical protein BJ165DRAFT_1487511 [Panaeolus papilionaceus]|nr:hypothetical protein BJ165DRAFT_1487511 [Panaeolus papilionaceus]